MSVVFLVFAVGFSSGIGCAIWELRKYDIILKAKP